MRTNICTYENIILAETRLDANMKHLARMLFIKAAKFKISFTVVP